MRASFPLLAGLSFAAILLGCDSPAQQASSEPPTIVVDQLPDYPVPGRDSDFPGGLVAAFWRDGRMIRCIDLKSIGKSYEGGIVPSKKRDKLLSFLRRTAIVRAPKVDGIPLHTATQTISVRIDGKTSRWTRILPDAESVWQDVESRLLSIPLQQSHSIEPVIAERIIREK